MKKNVAILGASAKTDRYSNMAQKILVDQGYNVYPVNPGYENIDGVKCYKSYSDIKDEIHSLLIYMNPSRLNEIIPEILFGKPERIIFNPGSEDDEIENLLKQNGIEIIEACSLVLLKSGRF